MIEQVGHPYFSKPWFSPLQEGLKDRFALLTSAVDEGVEMGIHLCYSDIEHDHFVKPKNARHLVEMANLTMSMAPRHVDWIHMPVPKNRVDDDYYAPMKELRLRNETHIYLGPAHVWDFEGTQKRISTASKVLETFGVATECGMGRTPTDEFEAVMEVLAEVSKARAT